MIDILFAKNTAPGQSLYTYIDAEALAVVYRELSLELIKDHGSTLAMETTKKPSCGTR